MDVPQRHTRNDAAGEPVLSYAPGVRDGRQWADRVEATGPGAVDLILTEMGGWALSCSSALGRTLLARGAVLARQGCRMTRDLGAHPPPAEWAALRPDPTSRIVPCDRPADRLLEAWRCAYPAHHPDHYPHPDAVAVRDRLAPLLSGRLHGPLLPSSALVVDGDDRVVAAVVVNGMVGVAPWGGPWITELFRRPDPSYAGLGTLLLRRTLARAAAGGLTAISLVVTDANPARRLYQRHGFRTTDRFLTVIIPDR